MNIRLARRIVQASGILFMVAVPLLNLRDIDLISGTYYSMSFGPIWITDPVIGIQTLLTTHHIDAKLLLSLVLPVLIALALGRVFCGWVCPQNTLSEIADRIAAKIGIKRIAHPAPRPIVRYVFLALILALTALTQLPLVSLLSAPGILSVQTAELVHNGVIGADIFLIIGILLVEMFVVRRAWCNFVCPIGSLLGLLRWKKTMRVAYSEDGGRICGRCLHCAQACQLGLDPVAGGIAPQCHNCGDCITACAAIDTQRKPLTFEF